MKESNVYLVSDLFFGGVVVRNEWNVVLIGNGLLLPGLPRDVVCLPHARGFCGALARQRSETTATWVPAAGALLAGQPPHVQLTAFWFRLSAKTVMTASREQAGLVVATGSNLYMTLSIGLAEYLSSQSFWVA